MIKKYQKDFAYSYTTGFYPTFELIKYKKEYLKCVYVNPSAVDTDGFKKLQTSIHKEKIIISENVFNKLMLKENDNVIGVFDKYNDKLDKDDNHVVLQRPSDMGNLGNIMRTMNAFLYKNLAIIVPTADIFNPKTIRASMGSIFKINIELFTSFEEYIEKYKDHTYYPFALQNSKPMQSLKNNKKPYSLLYGNESTGLDRELLNENTLKIEQAADIDSLNLTTAVAVSLYYIKNLENN